MSLWRRLTPLCSRASSQLLARGGGWTRPSQYLQPPQQPQQAHRRIRQHVRTLSTAPGAAAQQFKAKPPKEVSRDMADGIQQSNRLILQHGIGKQRLVALAEDPSTPITAKWQRMMEVYLGTQLHVLASLGYDANEQGIMDYTRQLSSFVSSCDSELQEKFRRHGRETWRDMLATTFDLRQLIAADGEDELSIVDARNIMHKVSTKLIEPSVLNLVAEKCAKVDSGGDMEAEISMKHQIIQDVVVNNVYLNGSPSLIEELGFGSGDRGYAYMQYRMAFYENDPLCVQYTTSAMTKIWKAAGLDLGENAAALTGKMPMSAPR